MLDLLKKCTVICASKGYGSFLTIELSREIQPDQYEQLSLLVYLCKWCLSQSGKPIVNETTVRPDTNFDFLSGQMLKVSNLLPNAGGLEFLFSNEITIRVVPDLIAYEKVDDLIMLTLPNGNTHGYSPANGWSQ